MTDRAWAATRKGLFELRRRGGAWAIERVSFLGEPVTMLLPPDDQGRMLAALNLGHFGAKVHASDDAGVTWHEVAVPVYPPQPEGAPGPAWKLEFIWALTAAHGTVWAGTLPGGLFRSSDLGRSWQLVESLWNVPGRPEWFGGGYEAPGIHSICLHPNRPGEVLVALSSAGIWASSDDGATWELRGAGLLGEYMPPDQQGRGDVQDVHRMVRCIAEPEVLWCQHHCGIWRSADDARSWQRVQAPLSSFGFAVAAHPSDPGTAWFAPAVADQNRVPVGGALMVNRTRDGGRTFETLRDGLPQQHCYDLVYRHGLVVAPDGRALLMGSTTGGLWASDDGGDHWVTVSERLPPIYALRFG